MVLQSFGVAELTSAFLLFFPFFPFLLHTLWSRWTPRRMQITYPVKDDIEAGRCPVEPCFHHVSKVQTWNIRAENKNGQWYPGPWRVNNSFQIQPEDITRKQGTPKNHRFLPVHWPVTFGPKQFMWDFWIKTESLHFIAFFIWNPLWLCTEAKMATTVQIRMDLTVCN